jgi:hypothetical protein
MGARLHIAYIYHLGQHIPSEDYHGESPRVPIQRILAVRTVLPWPDAPGSRPAARLYAVDRRSVSPGYQRLVGHPCLAREWAPGEWPIQWGCGRTLGWYLGYPGEDRGGRRTQEHAKQNGSEHDLIIVAV